METQSYLSHISAALHWDIPCLHVVLGYPSKESMLLKQATEHRCYNQNNMRTESSRKKAYVRSLPLPKKAILYNAGDFVASPELVFLDLASQLSFHQTLLLGMQLCSSSPNGSDPLTTTKKLISFLGTCKSHKGKKPALVAAKYLVDNSWSIMESLLCMMLSLPCRHGGYGLDGVELNHCIGLRKKSDWQKTNKVFADLLWRQARLVVEYDSYEFHNTVNSWVKDSRRATVLERNGYKTLSLNTAQIYSDVAMAEAAHAIAAHLGRRIRVRTPRFLEQKALLRGLLPRRESALLVE